MSDRPLPPKHFAALRSLAQGENQIPYPIRYALERAGLANREGLTESGRTYVGAYAEHPEYIAPPKARAAHRNGKYAGKPKTVAAGQRSCLRCRVQFMSSGPGNRLCAVCRHLSD